MGVGKEKREGEREGEKKEEREAKTEMVVLSEWKSQG